MVASVRCLFLTRRSFSFFACDHQAGDSQEESEIGVDDLPTKLTGLTEVCSLATCHVFSPIYVLSEINIELQVTAAKTFTSSNY